MLVNIEAQQTYQKDKLLNILNIFPGYPEIMRNHTHNCILLAYKIAPSYRREDKSCHKNYSFFGLYPDSLVYL